MFDWVPDTPPMRFRMRRALEFALALLSSFGLLLNIFQRHIMNNHRIELEIASSEVQYTIY